jgi:hypothetical protein
MRSSPQSAQWQYVHMDAAFVAGTAQQLGRMLHEIMLRRGEDDSLLFEEYWRLNNGCVLLHSRRVGSDHGGTRRVIVPPHHAAPYASSHTVVAVKCAMQAEPLARHTPSEPSVTILSSPHPASLGGRCRTRML